MILGCRIKWGHALVFAIAAVALSYLNATVVRWLNVGMSLPLSLVFGVAIQVIFGGCYFGERGINRQGAALAFKGGVQLMVIYVLLVAIVWMITVGATVAATRAV